MKRSGFMPKLLSVLLGVALMAGVIAGCGGGLEETYMDATLREATRGDLLSPGFKFAFKSPNIVATNGHLALVREDNLIEIFKGAELAKKLDQVSGKNYVMGARKLFSPLIHFTVDFLATGMDTVKVGRAYDAGLPNLLKATEFTADEYEDINVGALNWSTRTLKEIINTRFNIEEARLYHEEVEAPDGATRMEYVLELTNVRFIIDDPSPGMELFLKALINEGLYFKGGVDYGDRPDTSQRYRRNTKIGGKIKVKYIEYGNRVAVAPE
jgi:hypothetical protein